MRFKKRHVPYNKGKTHIEIYGEEKAKYLKELKSKNTKGKHFSPNTEFKKGSSGFKGHHTEATKELLRIKGLNQVFSKERNKKISDALKKQHKEGRRLNIYKKISLSKIGHIVSDETREKIRAKRLNKKLSDEVKLKISMALKGKNMGENNAMKRIEVRNKMAKSSLGKRLSQQTKDKISVALKEYWNDKDYVKKVFDSRKKAFNRKIPNKPESIILSIIKKENLPFEYVGNAQFSIDRFNPDFIDKINKKIIECFGTYWHNLPRYKEQDRRRIETYTKNGYKTLIIWEDELNNQFDVSNKIKEFGGVIN